MLNNEFRHENTDHTWPRVVCGYGDLGENDRFITLQWFPKVTDITIVKSPLIEWQNR